MQIDVVVNLKARRGSERVASAVRAAMPHARVRSTRSLAEAVDFAEDMRADPPDLLVSAGGDGTAAHLLTAFRGTTAWAPGGRRGPALALLPLGTGNGWAHSVGAPGWREATRRLGVACEQGRALPTQPFGLVEVCGMQAPFAGTGWDAEILDDYSRVKSIAWLPRALREGFPGYMMALFGRSIPRALFRDPVEVEVTNLGAPALVIGPDGKPAPMVGGGTGAVLYRGPVSVAGCGTSPDLGFGFRAFPYLEGVSGRMGARVYAATTAQGVASMRRLWRGDSGLPHDHNWLVTACRFRYSRPVPFQIAGDRIGWKDEVEYRLAAQPVHMVDYRALAA